MIAAGRSGSAVLVGCMRLVVPASLLAGLLVGSADHQARAETADTLTADPQRLELVQAGCKANMAWTTPDICQAAAQAIRMRFQGGGVPYTPHTVDLFPSHPAMATPAPPPAAPVVQKPPAVQKPRSKTPGRTHRLARADAKFWR